MFINEIKTMNVYDSLGNIVFSLHQKYDTDFVIYKRNIFDLLLSQMNTNCSVRYMDNGDVVIDMSQKFAYLVRKDRIERYWNIRLEPEDVVVELAGDISKNILQMIFVNYK